MSPASTLRRSSVLREVALVLAAIVIGSAGQTQTRPTPAARAKTVLYAAVGAQLTQYDVDVDRATLMGRGTVTPPANVQEAALHPSRRHLYVGWSDVGASYGAAGVAAGQRRRHGVTTFRLHAPSGALTPDGPPMPLRARPIHLTTDVNGAHLLVAYNDPSGVTVHRIHQDTGEPTMIQTIDTRGFHPRTFALDASGRLLIAGNQNPLAVRAGNGIRTVPASLSVFSVGANGTLAFMRQYAVDADPGAGRSLFWMGLASLD